jgi:hypothetical protein
MANKLLIAFLSVSPWFPVSTLILRGDLVPV